LTASEELELLRSYRAAGGEGPVARSAVASLLEANMPLIAQQVRKYLRPGVEMDDLVQAGAVGYMAAIAKWDESYGCRLNTYAVFYARKAAQREAAGCPALVDEAFDVEAREVELPEDISDALAQLPPRHRYILDRRSHGETLEQVGRGLCLSKERVRQIEAEALGMVRSILQEPV
jgi:RNA polymerase sigma factor (sigma-70 family)